MAAPVGGAHLTSTVTVRPSVFEILSHEGFARTLKPAAHHVVKVLAENNPCGIFGLIYRYFDEIYLAFDVVIQWHYILTRGATLSEAFYGLERKLITTDQKLSRIRVSYVVSVLLPYISDKLEKVCKDVAEENVHNYVSPSMVSQNESIGTIAQRKRFALVYPHLKTALKAVDLLYLMSYTFGRSNHHSLTFKLLKMSLSYTSEERAKFMESKTAELFTLSQWKNPRNLPKLILRTLGESALWIVEIGTFFIQFLDWWHRDENSSRVPLSSLQIPSAPQTLNPQKVQSFVPLLSSDMNRCPLCRSEFRNPTAISVSGVVYCYGCILPYIRQNNKCPLTNLPCNKDHLIRVYR